MTVPGFTVLAVPHFFHPGQRRTSFAEPLLMFTATAPPRLNATTTLGWVLSNSARSEADTAFGLHDGITPFDADRIMSEFMTNGIDQSEVQGGVVYVTEK